MGRGVGGWLIGAGVVLVVAGLCVLGLERLDNGLGLGRLPGDFAYRGRNVKVFVPLGTCLLLSVLGSAVMWLLGRMRR